MALTEWLRKHNTDQPDKNKVGFYGLDMHSLWESIEAIMGYLPARERRRRSPASRTIGAALLPTVQQRPTELCLRSSIRTEELSRCSGRSAGNNAKEDCAL